MTESNWANAQRELECPKCGAADIHGAKPTLEVLTNGTILCAACSHVFKPEPPKAAA